MCVVCKDNFFQSVNKQLVPIHSTLLNSLMFESRFRSRLHKQNDIELLFFLLKPRIEDSWLPLKPTSLGKNS